MERFVQGEGRTQVTFLPELLDDCVTVNNPARVIDVFVDLRDLGKLGFEGAVRGRPTFLSSIQSSDDPHPWLPESHSVNATSGD